MKTTYTQDSIQTVASPSGAQVPVPGQTSTDETFKVVIMIDRLFFDLGGTEGQVMKMVQGLHSRVNVELIVLVDSQWLNELRQTSELKITVMNMAGGIKSLQFWKGFRTLVRYLRTSNVDVVHTFFPICNILGALAARLAGVRVIIGSRRDYGYWMSPGYLFFTKLANRMVDYIVTNSHEVKRLTALKEGYDAKHIEVIYNGLDLDQLKLGAPDLALKAAIGIPAHHRVVALVANFRTIKRQDSLIEMLALLKPNHDDISVLFVGSTNDPYFPVIEALIKDKGVGANVFFAHAKGDIQRYLSFMDIGCNCSESEGLSNAVMEYMAARVPCIVSDGGGNIDLITHEKNGLVYPVGDARMLTDHVLRILSDSAVRERFIEASLHRMNTEMSLPVIINRYEEYYRQAVRTAT